MSDLKTSKVFFSKFRKLVEREAPWSVDRFGRLFAGIGTLIFTTLGIFISPYFLIPVMGLNLNLVVTSFSNKCAFNKLLKSLGAEERENIYKVDGSVKQEKVNSINLHSLTERVSS